MDDVTTLLQNVCRTAGAVARRLDERRRPARLLTRARDARANVCTRAGDLRKRSNATA